MPVYGFNNEETARKVAAKYGPSYGSQQGSSLAESGSSPAQIRFRNGSNQVIPPFGIAFCTGVIDDGNSNWAVDVEPWTDIKSQSSGSIKFPVVNGRDSVGVGEWGVSQNRDGFQIIASTSGSGSVGSKFGPTESATGEQKFLIETGSNEELYEAVGQISPSVISMPQNNNYMLVRRLEVAEAKGLTFFIGDVTELGDFPGGRSGSGGGYNLFNTAPGIIKATGTIISDENPSGGSRSISALYFGPFPISVGASIAAIRWQTTGSGTGNDWWVVDCSRFELPATGPGGGTGGAG